MPRLNFQTRRGGGRRITQYSRVASPNGTLAELILYSPYLFDVNHDFVTMLKTLFLTIERSEQCVLTSI
jgi:hypothetical protein